MLRSEQMPKSKKVPLYIKLWKKYRKPAPKVPDITCPDIDALLTRLQSYRDTTKSLTQKQYNICQRELEKLRTANEVLRDSGQYWHDACQEVINDVFKFKKYKSYKK